MTPSTHTLLRAQADAYAAEVVGDSRDELFAARMRELLARAFMRGADAGYTARAAEERQP